MPSVRDWTVQYSGCLAKLLDPPEGVAAIVKMHDAESAEGDEVKTISVTAYKLDEGGVRTLEEPMHIDISRLELKLLPLDIINLQRSTVYLRPTVPEGNTKYRRLISPRNIRVTDTLSNIRRHLEIAEPSSIDNYHLLTAWAANEYPSPAEALERVSSNQYLASAFSSKFQFSMSLNTPSVVIMYLDRVIGKVRGEAVTLLPWAGRFKESLQSYGIEVAE